MKWFYFMMLGYAVFGFAQETTLMPVSVDVHDTARLQRGARFFMNYCSGCHSLNYLRYNQMAKALGLTTFDGSIDEDLLKNNLIFTKATVHDPIRIALPPEQAQQWFGIVPPDLSLKTKERGTAWIYTYLKSFYQDNSKPFKTNNLLVPNVAMPNVLQPLIGTLVLVQDKKGDASLLLVEQGEMYQDEFNSALEDLITFLAYVGEPAQLVRYRYGVGVILFLLVLLGLAYRIKKIYWSRL